MIRALACAALLAASACVASPEIVPAPFHLRPAVPVRLDGVIYEVRGAAGGVVVAGLPEGAAAADIARRAVAAVCGVAPRVLRPGPGAGEIAARAACPPLESARALRDAG